MNITGVWFNELGSKMELSINGNIISGTYESAVGSAAGQYTLSGVIDTDTSSGSQTVGWSVSWQNSSGDTHAVTSWSGQYQMINNTETITAMWILATATSPQDNWASTLIGQDIFTRNMPSASSVSAMQKQHAYRLG